MKPSRGSLASTAVPATVAALTTWIALFSWRGFTNEGEVYLGRLLLLAVLVAATGAVGRWWRMPGVALFPLQVILTVLVGASLLSGAWLPVGAGWHDLVGAFSDAIDTSRTYSSPVPRSVPSISPLLVSGGVGCLLMVDLLACTLRRVPLAGLPLLAVFSVPVSLLGGGLSAVVFVLTAIGFMSLLYLHEHDQVARWGRSLGPGGKDAFEPGGLGSGGRGLRRSARGIGGVATLLAVALPVVIPTVTLSVFDFGPGHGSGGDGIEVKNPIADLRRDLKRGEDIDLLTVRTDDPDPSYLAIAELNRFSGNKWSSGDRDIPNSQLADGALPPLPGVSPSVRSTAYDVDIGVSDDFKSTWLPTLSPITAVDADGDWRYDLGTRDIIAAGDDLTTAGISYTQTAVKLDLDQALLLAAPAAGGLVDDELTELPSDLPPIVKNLATQVTAGQSSAFAKAVALQRWFRSEGGFTYDLSTDLGDGTDDLVSFLTPGDGGRTGYCQQFAASMAVMARVLGIPARVTVGFLHPAQVGKDTYVYSSHDLHAWPELYFPGSGWVRFEPTPPTRAESVPAYTRISAVQPTDPPETSKPDETGLPSSGGPLLNKPTVSVAQDAKGGDTERTQDGGVSRLLPVLLLVLALLVVLLLLVLPVLVRRRRRAAHLAGGAEGAWSELRDTAADLRLGWPRDRSPRETRAWLAERLGGDHDSRRSSLAALDVVVLAVERARYARREPVGAAVGATVGSAVDPAAGSTAGEGFGPGAGVQAGVRVGGTGQGDDALHDAVQTCVAALREGVADRTRRRATYLPASVLGRAGGTRASVRRSARSGDPAGPSVDAVS